jgi:hypothetical protein
LTLLEGSLDLPIILVIELGRHKRSVTNNSLYIEETLVVGGKRYDLLAALMCDGSHTTCYFWHSTSMYFYDGMMNNGMAFPVTESVNSSSKKNNYDHLVYICREVR